MISIDQISPIEVLTLKILSYQATLSYWSFQNVFTLDITHTQIQSKRWLTLMLFMFQNKDKDLLGIYQYGCDPFCVSSLTDRLLKVRSNTDFVMISRQRHVYVCAWLVASRFACQKLGHDNLRYVSNFWRSECDNYFLIGKKPSRKHFEKNSSTGIIKMLSSSSAANMTWVESQRTHCKVDSKINK